MHSFLFFWIVLKSALFSIGGFGPLPSLHADLISRGWAKEHHFVEALSVGQVTPGPNGLWVVSLCYLIGGWAGAILGCIALTLPPLFVLVTQKFYTSISNRPATQGVLDGIVLVIVSFSVIALCEIFKSYGLHLDLLAIAAVSGALAISRRVHTNTILVAAVVIGFFLK